MPSPLMSTFGVELSEIRLFVTRLFGMVRKGIGFVYGGDHVPAIVLATRGSLDGDITRL